jgi:prophage maintenance system killer protein
MSNSAATGATRVCGTRVCWRAPLPSRRWRSPWPQRHPTMPAQAAADLYHPSRAHAFMDANKRTSLACALIWLALHDLELALSPADLFDLTLAVAQGHRSLDDTVKAFETAVKINR